MNQLQFIKRVKVLHPIYRNHEPWIDQGEYKVIREFDRRRYLIETSEGLTLVEKILTNPIK